MCILYSLSCTIKDILIVTISYDCAESYSNPKNSMLLVKDL